MTKMMDFKLIFCVLLCTTFCCKSMGQRSSFPLPDVLPEERQFRVVYEWNTIGFAYRTEADRSNAIFSNTYIPQNNIISDVKAFANRLYLTIPRMLPGVPATLGWVVAPNDDGRTDPEIEPFPSWEMNEIGNCSALQFVQGIAIDTDGVMWVIDSGRVNTLQQDTRSPDFHCRPKLLLIDTKTNGTLLLRYDFPNHVVAQGTNYLNKIVIDDAFGGYAYITDNSGADPGIVVYSKRLNRSWKVRESNSMRAAVNAQDFAVNGTRLNFAIHIDGIALGPYYSPNGGGIRPPLNTPPSFLNRNDQYERNVYYSPLSSYHLYSIPASFLRDPEFARTANNRQLLNAITDLGLKVSQTDGMIMDNRGILYYGLLKEHAIAQWDSYLPFTPQNQHIIAKDDTFIQWTDGMSFDEEGNFYVVVNRLHNFVTGRLNVNEVNFRLLKSKTGSLSYVYTNSFGADSNIGILSNPPSIFLGDGGIDDNGIGLSSTTPQFSSLSSTSDFDRDRAFASTFGFNPAASVTSSAIIVCLHAITLLFLAHLFTC